MKYPVIWWQLQSTTISPPRKHNQFVMTSAVLFANLDKHVSQPPSIHFMRIHSWNAGLKDRDLDHSILGFCRVPDDLDLSASNTQHKFDDYHRKASLKGKKLAIRVCQVLNGNASKFPPRDVASNNGCDSPFVCRGGTAVVGGPPFEGRARDIEGVSWYQEIRFIFRDDSVNQLLDGFISVQTLHFSCPTLKVESGTFDNLDQLAYDRVEILSGMCLFNAKILQMSLPEKGGVDVAMLKVQKPTLYEMDYLARSSSAVSVNLTYYESHHYAVQSIAEFINE